MDSRRTDIPGRVEQQSAQGAKVGGAVWHPEEPSFPIITANLAASRPARTSRRPAWNLLRHRGHSRSEAVGMSRPTPPRLPFLALLTFLNGCGLLPTDRPPTDNPYGASYFPDDRQSKWNRILFGTRWIAEGPPPPTDPAK